MQKKIKALKHLGQNFLQSPAIANKIVSLLGDIANKNVLEIGPGMGALTSHLISSEADLTCFEVDSRAIEYLNEKFADTSNLTIIQTDIRNTKVNNYLSCEQQKLSVIGNIPYNITNDVLFWLLDNSDYIDRAVLTIQKEVAKRYTAKENTKEYGITTLALKLFGNSKICFHIPAGAFFPVPSVISSVLQIDFDSELYGGVNKLELIKFIRASFSMRRKILSNSLHRYFVEHNIDIVKLSQTLSHNNKPFLKCRAEQLTLEEYILFYNFLFTI